MTKGKRRETTEVLEVRETDSLVVHHTIRLKVVRGPGSGKIIELKSKPVLAGRADEVDLYLDDPAASRKHFEVAPERGEFILRDLGSTNGTRLNKVPMLECRLSNGDIISVGQIDVAFIEELEVKA